MLLLRVCTGAALLAAVSHAYCWMTEDNRSDRCWIRDGKGFTRYSNLQKCTEECKNDSECQAATLSGSLCYTWKQKCADPADHEDDLDQNFAQIIYKDCHNDSGYTGGKGAIWCRYSDENASGYNCLWSGSERSGHGCKASGCYGDQCCYDTKDTAESYCNQYHSECKGFWKASDGFWYVRGTGPGGWVDDVNYPNSVYYMKIRDYAQLVPLCEARSINHGAWGCLGGVCLDNNHSVPTLEAARKRCAQVAGCDQVMRWTNGYWYMRRENDPYYTAAQYPGVTYVKRGCYYDDLWEDSSDD